MTTHAPAARLPFAPLDHPRLQYLASAKNRQNGIIAQKSTSAKCNTFNKAVIYSPVTNKRSYEHSTFDDLDSENVEPAMSDYSPPKKTKSEASKPFTFTISTQNSMMPPPAISSRVSTPVRSSMPSPQAPMTAPAGRSPKRKIAGMKSNRRISAPYSRIDPPFASRGASTLPFSLDAALSGTLSTPAAEPKSVGATIQESMPKNWFFEIYEDTPEEEAANLMEHSTLTLDLSSDDESEKNESENRGKENTPPEGYDAPTASRSAAEPTVAAPMHIKKTEIIRKKIVADDMDDGERSPLSDLETESFIPEGLSKDSVVVVDEVVERKIDEVLAAPSVPFEDGKEEVALPAVDLEGEMTSAILVWEDAEKEI